MISSWMFLLLFSCRLFVPTQTELPLQVAPHISWEFEPYRHSIGYDNNWKTKVDDLVGNPDPSSGHSNGIAVIRGAHDPKADYFAGSATLRPIPIRNLLEGADTAINYSPPHNHQKTTHAGHGRDSVDYYTDSPVPPKEQQHPRRHHRNQPRSNKQQQMSLELPNQGNHLSNSHSNHKQHNYHHHNYHDKRRHQQKAGAQGSKITPKDPMHHPASPWQMSSSPFFMANLVDSNDDKLFIGDIQSRASNGRDFYMNEDELMIDIGGQFATPSTSSAWPTVAVNGDGQGLRLKELFDHWPTKHESVVEGDLILGGLMMVHEREDSVTCGPIMPQGGIQALEAMLYTLDRVNEMKLLPDFTLGAHILDDCDKDTYGLEMAVDFIKGTSSGQAVCSLNNTDPECRATVCARFTK